MFEAGSGPQLLAVIASAGKNTGLRGPLTVRGRDGFPDGGKKTVEGGCELKSAQSWSQWN